MKKFVALGLVIVVAVIAFVYLWSRVSYREQRLLPTDVYEVFALTDSVVGGASTSDVLVKDSVVEADINVRTGTSYPYAGIGVNLLSERHKPAADFFDFSQFDSVEVEVSSGRLRTVEIRILNNDPVYSKEGDFLSYRPQVKTIPANGKTKFPLSDFRTPEWWLAMQGLEKDDYLTYFERGVLVAVVNGEGALRGIPDRILVKSLKFWKGNAGQ